ncbi:MAG TPA: ParB/RepB/Spo0J family partition protein [Ignavibacteriaceae bacterium]|nr:ParB/RepB/Spo0J family partition protein [Ignavibacteriaceae bacterium]
MSKLKPGLGRGLDALINPDALRDSKKTPADYSDLKKDEGHQVDIMAKIPVDMIKPNPFQPRSNFEPEALDELKKSILSNGLIQPITVRRSADKGYELISGERRLKACKDIGYRDIPAYIIKVDSNEAMLALSLIENIQRERLNPIEIGLAYKRLIEECSLTQEEIAEKVGKDRSTVANSIRLLKLPPEIQESLIKDEISSGHARAIINLPTSSLQLGVLKKIINNNLSVRKVEQLVKKIITETSTPRRNVSGKHTVKISSSNLSDVEDKLRKIFGTKVSCKQKQGGAGEIIIEFYSNDELERLFELFEIIDKTYN